MRKDISKKRDNYRIHQQRFTFVIYFKSPAFAGDFLLRRNV